MFIIKLLFQFASGIIMPIIRRTSVQCRIWCSALVVLNTICGSAHSCSPDDGHNDAWNMLR